MDGAGRLEVLHQFQVADGFEVLDGDGLVVLGAASEDVAGVGGVEGGEGRVEPLVGFGGDGVEVGVEEDGREGRVGARPGEEQDGLTCHKF